MRGLRLKVSDLSRVTGYSRFQIRGLLAEVFGSAGIGRKTGAQQTFSPQELLVVAVACEIETTFGVGRKRLALVGEALRKTLSGPRAANREARLLVTFSPPSVAYLAGSEPVTQGLILPLGAQFSKVDEYLGVSGTSDNGQSALGLRPAVVASRRSSGVRG